MKLPFVHRREYDRLLIENFTLRDALREANAELYKHRTLIAGLRTGHTAMTAAVEKVFQS